MRRIALGVLLGLIVAAAGALVALEVSNSRNIDPAWVDYVFVAILCMSTGVGTVLVTRRGENPIGWLLLVNGLVIALSGVASEGAIYAVLEHPGTSGGALAALVSQTSWPLLFAPFVAIAFVFPDGRLPSARWRPVAWGAAISLLLTLMLLLFAPRELEEPFDSGREPSPSAPGHDLQRAVPGLRDRDGRGARRLRPRGAHAHAARHGPGTPAGQAARLRGCADPDRRRRRLDGEPPRRQRPARPRSPRSCSRWSRSRWRSGSRSCATASTRSSGSSTARSSTRRSRMLLAATYGAVSLALGVALGSGSTLATAAATLTVALVFGQLRGRVQRLVDRRFNRRPLRGPAARRAPPRRPARRPRHARADGQRARRGARRSRPRARLRAARRGGLRRRERAPGGGRRPTRRTT